MSGKVDDKFGDRPDDVCRCGRARHAGVHDAGAQNGHAFDPWRPSTAADVTDEKLAVGEVRALRRDVNDRLDSIARTLVELAKFGQKLDVIIDRQNVIEARIDDHERRLAALETNATRPKRARKKPRK